MCCWILFASILLRIFASVFISDIGPDQAFLYFLVKIFTLYICSFPNSANSFITNGLNSFSGKLFISVSLFFFQAEDGIRDSSVTGVQTCALPISYGFSPSIC